VPADSPLRTIEDVDRDGVRVAVGNKGRFMQIEQAMGTPKGRENGARYLGEFAEEMKASGFVARALERSGQPDATVAPPHPLGATAGH